MSFDTFEKKSATLSSQRPRFGIVGAVVLLMSHFIFLLSLKIKLLIMGLLEAIGMLSCLRSGC